MYESFKSYYFIYKRCLKVILLGLVLKCKMTYDNNVTTNAFTDLPLLFVSFFVNRHFLYYIDYLNQL